jgi:hypothetical protein
MRASQFANHVMPVQVCPQIEIAWILSALRQQLDRVNLPGFGRPQFLQTDAVREAVFVDLTGGNSESLRERAEDALLRQGFGVAGRENGVVVS